MSHPFDLLDCTSLSTGEAASPEAVARRRAALARPPEGPSLLHDHRAAARAFQADVALRVAINTALAVEMPLLVTGEPGTGKTQVAWFIAAAFGLGDPIALSVKSTTTHQDLRYEYDAVGYLRDANDPARREEARHRWRYVTRGPLWKALASPAADGAPPVLLIDEIDKAPRDFPNDLLHELDQYAFPVPELYGCAEAEVASLGVRRREDGHFGVERRKDRRAPIVVVTSNAERRLPEAFLRRCVFHHIDLTPPLVERAVAARRTLEFPDLDDATRASALEAFWVLRDLGLRKKPSTAELLAWLQLLQRSPEDRRKLVRWERHAARLPFLSALVKDGEDMRKVLSR